MIFLVRIPAILLVSIPSSGRLSELDGNNIPIDFDPPPQKTVAKEKRQNLRANLLVFW
jgi:hypothetical protein